MTQRGDPVAGHPHRAGPVRVLEEQAQLSREPHLGLGVAHPPSMPGGYATLTSGELRPGRVPPARSVLDSARPAGSARRPPGSRPVLELRRKRLRARGWSPMVANVCLCASGPEKLLIIWQEPLNPARPCPVSDPGKS